MQIKLYTFFWNNKGNNRWTNGGRWAKIKYLANTNCQGELVSVFFFEKKKDIAHTYHVGIRLINQRPTFRTMLLKLKELLSKVEWIVSKESA